METREISFLAVLGVVFVILKWTALISWSWWIVLLPFILIILGPIIGKILFAIVGLLTDNFR